MTSESLDPAAPTACPACQAGLHGRYCSDCGQDSRPDSRGAAFLMRDAFAEVFSLEGKTWHTLRDVVRRPSRLLNAYRTGVGDYYFSPFKLFLVMSATVFLFLSWTNVAIYQFLPFRTPAPIGVELIEHGVRITGIEYRDAFFRPYDPDPTVPALEARLDAAAAIGDEAQRTAIAEYRAYNAGWLDLNSFFSVWIPRILWFLMPAYALMMGVFFHRRPFADHMLFTIWAHCVAGALFMLLSVGNLLGAPSSVWLALPPYLGMFVFAARGFYGGPWWQMGLKAVGHLLLYGLLVMLVLLGVVLVYAEGRINPEMLLGDGYLYVDGATEVRAPPAAE